MGHPQTGEPWLLVTSAFNMPLAVASFRGVGFAVIPYPVDYRTRPADLRRPVATLADGLAELDIAAHEWPGLLAYRLTGKTRSCCPVHWGTAKAALFVTRCQTFVYCSRSEPASPSRIGHSGRVSPWQLWTRCISIMRRPASSASLRSISTSLASAIAFTSALSRSLS